MNGREEVENLVHANVSNEHCQYHVLRTLRCKTTSGIGEFGHGLGFFWEELKVKIPDARLHMSFNLAGKILTPLNLSILAGSSAPSCMCIVGTHWGQPSKIDKLTDTLKEQPSVTSTSTWLSTNLIFASTF